MRSKNIMGPSRNRELANETRGWKVALVLLSCIVAVSIVGTTRAISSVRYAAGQSPADIQATFKQYCVQCHGLKAPKAGVSLERLMAETSVGDNFQQWEKVAHALEQKLMPP